MKKIHVSKFSIFIISIVAFAFGVYAVITTSHSSPTISNQNERIYLHTTYPNDYEGYVKISDMKQDSYGYFMYPSSYNYSDKWNSYQRFLLIRLPSWLGGDKNDTSSFRAYSQLDIASHCLVNYRPSYSQNIYDPCWFERYRIIDGAAAYQSVKVLVKPIHNALPQLDLIVDNDGYLNVKPPTWTEDKNGIVGEGRILPVDEIRKSSEFLLQSYKKMSGTNLNIPLQLQTGEFLILFSNAYRGEHSAQLEYQNLETWNGTASLSFEFCNCSSPNFNVSYSEDQLWQVNGIPMIVIGEGQPDPKTNDYQGYMIIFTKNGYQISLSEQKSFRVITGEIFNDFYNNTSNSTIEKMTVG